MRERQGHEGRQGRRDHEHRGQRGQKAFDKEGNRDFNGSHHKKVQTFRRGRAIAFLEKLQVNRSTLQRQLEDPQLESIKQVISGELKAIEMVMDDFIHMFQLDVTEGSVVDASEEVTKPAEDVNEEGTNRI
ncbi:hypothetical protein QPK24_11900 [Paenibacillus polygoni]|uniref:Uncharacterized protein n=1 Tax=Paenibacillus polygoni TaxID=3050112 RepID=A0ABY8XCX3_9BACL|nr:hypothetical protein [Paenibacillus polygoni]WIV21325.1 hypothetical protein QPK24_11900 [Paenibacillus polygoni]